MSKGVRTKLGEIVEELLFHTPREKNQDLVSSEIYQNTVRNVSEFSLSFVDYFKNSTLTFYVLPSALREQDSWYSFFEGSSANKSAKILGLAGGVGAQVGIYGVAATALDQPHFMWIPVMTNSASGISELFQALNCYAIAKRSSRKNQETGEKLLQSMFEEDSH